MTEPEVTEEVIRSRWDEGRKVAAAGGYGEALEHYLFAYDASLDIDSLYALRGSYMLGDLAQLGAVYPPAREALVERRDETAARVRASADKHTISDLIQLNKYLGEPDHTIAFYDELRAGNETERDQAELLFDSIWKELAKRHRYEELEELALYEIKEVFEKIAQYEINTELAPEIPFHPLLQEGHQRWIFKTGPVVYEVLLGLNKETLAEKLAKRLQSFDPSDEMRGAMQEHAARARDANVNS